MARQDDWFAGVIFLICGVAFIGVALVFNGPDQQSLKHLAPLQTTTIPPLNSGDRVLVEGYVSPHNPIWQQGLVVGTKQTFQGGDEGWRDEQEFSGSFVLALRNGQTIAIHTEGLIPRGNFATIPQAGNPDLRWIGYRPRAELTCWGEVSARLPRLRIDVEDAACFGGSADDFSADVTTENRWFGILALISLLIGSYLVWQSRCLKQV